MKRIKNGIRRDFDKIQHKSKEELLSAAGVCLEAEKNQKFNFLKLAPAIAVYVLVFSLGAVFALAVTSDNEGSIVSDIKNIFIAEESQEPEEAEIPTKIQMEQGFEAILEYRGADGKHPPVSFYRSVKDIVADMGDGLYYPSYEPLVNSPRPFVIVGSHGIQINYMLDEHILDFHINQGYSKEDGMYDPYAERYQALGTVFYISHWHEWLNGCFTEGVIDGNHYSFVADNAQRAKEIIDSLEKCE